MCNEKITQHGSPRLALVKAEPANAQIRLSSPGSMRRLSHTIDVRPNALSSIDMQTSAVDRAKGFLISTVPLFVGLATLSTLAAAYLFELPILCFATTVIFWLTFIGAWLAAYVYTLRVSAEGIALFEARSKWDVIKKEQEERWAYIHRLEGKGKYK
jgi:hypothetical protein